MKWENLNFNQKCVAAEELRKITLGTMQHSKVGFDPLQWKIKWLKEMLSVGQVMKLIKEMKNPDLARSLEYAIKQEPWAFTISVNSEMISAGNFPAKGRITIEWPAERPYLTCNKTDRDKLSYFTSNTSDAPKFSTKGIFVETNFTARQWVEMVQVMTELSMFYSDAKLALKLAEQEIKNTAKQTGTDAEAELQNLYYFDNSFSYDYEGKERPLLEKLFSIVWRVPITQQNEQKHYRAMPLGILYLNYMWVQGIYYYLGKVERYKVLFCKPQEEKQTKILNQTPISEFLQDAPTDIFRLMERAGYLNPEKMNLIDFLDAQVLLLKGQIRKAKSEGVKPLELAVKTGIPLTIISSL